MKWQQRQATNLDQQLIEDYGLTDIQAKLFALRGIDTTEKLDFWLNATEEDLADPFLMHDMEKTINRINQAIDNGEKITIYGDYDADGITATSIMMDTLEILGADVHFFIPDRFKDGYGPSMDRYQDIVNDGTKLIITVDNGVTGVEEIKYAQEHGVDVILTDHHTFQDEKPAAFSTVHCNYSGQKYPFDDYCGAGVAYTICRALMQDTMPELLDLAMIGTIGDMVKVTGEGHIIVKRGLDILNQTERPGLRALIKQAGLTMGQINATDVGFNIAPRLNAVGRLADASLAVELLLSDNEEQAEEIAAKIEELNNERKELTTEVYENCLAQVKDNGWQHRDTLVLYNPNFHEGVLGLVANKIVEKLHKPTLVLTKDEEGELKGSGRSSEGFNLFDALEPMKEDLLDKFGGHDFACGLSLRSDKLEELRERFEKSFKPTTSLEVKDFDFELNLREVSPETLNEIDLVGPFGTGNPEPIFSITEPHIKSLFKMGKEKNHVKFTAEKNKGKLTVVGFNKGFLNQNLLPFVKELYVTLSINTWKNVSTVQGMLAGIEYGAPKLAVFDQVIDMRKEDYVMGFADKYLIFDKDTVSWARNGLGIPEEKISLAKDYHGSSEVVALLDTPRNQIELNKALENNYQQLYLRFLFDKLPINDLPSRDAFGKTLKYIYAHPDLTIDDYRTVSPYLGLDYQTVLFILRVFFELKFVSFTDGKIIGNKNPESKKLTASRYFNSIASQIKFTNQLKNIPTDQLINYVMQYLK
ncbi:single-stranded-DNA-specific exonuclease RecJ [Lactobacillus taiwanensis]|uniref:single-stranded-DNA-specific exonuclease RecJ n=2 Tax=Lactobacillus taiwanensis TaxID=508451 RepID=UPI000B98525D|nr:single-stranded-DNA-specific exonuclease RecJ [Lactobacillus taiwanensis]OYR99056.1 single-stranded-DNA-specific exonuclease RecJ [Lactobacillus taiwanensis]OYS02757.1 single-stranded-DNA-specific exonuclease RecJ [Lactobacillus taiwanensis]